MAARTGGARAGPDEAQVAQGEARCERQAVSRRRGEQARWPAGGEEDTTATATRAPAAEEQRQLGRWTRCRRRRRRGDGEADQHRAAMSSAARAAERCTGRGAAGRPDRARDDRGARRCAGGPPCGDRGGGQEREPDAATAIEAPRQVEAVDRRPARAVSSRRVRAAIQPTRPTAGPAIGGEDADGEAVDHHRQSSGFAVTPMAASKPSWRCRRWATTTKPGGAREGRPGRAPR